MTRFAWVILLLAAVAPASANSSGFIYVPVRPSSCGSTVGCASQLLVFDGSTGAPVITVPLAVDMIPAAVAVSPDGKHVYIASDRFFFNSPNPSTLTVVDTSTYAIIGTYPLPLQPVASVPPFVGRQVSRLATTPDDSRVYILAGPLVAGGMLVEAFDTASHQVVAAAGSVSNGTYDVAFSATTGHVYVLTGSPVTGGPNTHLSVFDGATLAFITERAWSGVSPLTLSSSSDGKRLVLLQFDTRPSDEAIVYSLLDPVSLADLATFSPPADISASAPEGGAKELVTTGEVISAYQPVLQRVNMTTGAVIESPLLPNRAAGLAVTPDERRAFVVTVSSKLLTIDLNAGVLTTTLLLPGSGPAAATPAGASSCTYRLDSLYSSWPRTGGTGGVRLTTGCAWAATSSAPWVHLVGPPGLTGQGNSTFGLTIDAYPPPLSGPYVTRSATVTIGGQVLTVTQAGAITQPPFGFIDTPGDNATGITGSMPMTGWALDDVGVARVRIFRDPVAGEPAGQVYLGDATFVDGARPDVQAFFPTLPFASRAGWGYLLLTNMLPAAGTGTYRLYAYADDIEGRTTLLGSRTITCANSTATAPFGAIDTPGQGEVVSGTITNWGWALSPQSLIPLDGSTIDVVIDNVVVGHPVYGVNRPDVAALFPGYANTNGAGGYFTLDTTTLANGIHTLAWLVRDSAGNLTAVGSRYFTVENP